ncbi:hypothetical protein ASZ90_020054 [hydrocarbon metagenome]|uniref:Uncharacterized protein n=1 Tax=hydrocarbon metagenome TaxID=938273 RepID=A0A0W8E1S5_9ZZZZ
MLHGRFSFLPGKIKIAGLLPAIQADDKTEPLRYSQSPLN